MKLLSPGQNKAVQKVKLLHFSLEMPQCSLFLIFHAFASRNAAKNIRRVNVAKSVPAEKNNVFCHLTAPHNSDLYQNFPQAASMRKWLYQTTTIPY